MTSLRNYPLGERCPKSPHAVVSSLPTMADVRGYEEHDPRVIEALTSGYPRFVVHAFIEELIGYYLRREGLEDRLGVLIPSQRATNDLIDYVGNWKREPLCPHQDNGGEAGQVSEQSTRRAFHRTLPLTAVRVEDSLFLVHFDRDDRELKQRVRKFVQHTGCGISSRQAEDLLVRYRLRDSVHTECVVKDRLEEKVEGALAGLIGCESKDVLVCSCGMNAFYAGFRAVHEAQSSKGRTNWLQLGWLYLDSGCVLKEFLGESDSLDYCYDATDINEIVEKIESYGDTLACVVIECPTNPLVQVADLPRIKQAVRENGGILMVDPTIASIYNVDVLHYADILVTSLTKYASHLGDVMIGALALNPQSAHYGDLVLRSSSFYQPPYSRDLARLAFEMETAPEAVSLMDLNARRLADYLSGHHGVKQVHYAGYSDHFTEVAKSPGSGGAMISVELKGDIEPFYDALTAMKGPSFGTDFTLVCPFMFLAHYDMVTSEEGTNFLRSIGIDPNLIRISVGVEPIEDIIRIFESALSN